MCLTSLWERRVSIGGEVGSKRLAIAEFSEDIAMSAKGELSYIKLTKVRETWSCSLFVVLQCNAF